MTYAVKFLDNNKKQNEKKAKQKKRGWGVGGLVVVRWGCVGCVGLKTKKWRCLHVLRWTFSQQACMQRHNEAIYWMQDWREMIVLSRRGSERVELRHCCINVTSLNVTEKAWIKWASHEPQWSRKTEGKREILCSCLQRLTVGVAWSSRGQPLLCKSRQFQSLTGVKVKQKCRWQLLSGNK